MQREEDRACDFLHLGSGWKASVEDSSNLTVKKIFSACLDADRLVCEPLFKRSALSLHFENKATKPFSVHRQGSNRSAPYTRDTKGLRVNPDQQRPRCNNTSRDQVKTVQCNQADFEDLSLGPGCPSLDALDFHF